MTTEISRPKTIISGKENTVLHEISVKTVSLIQASHNIKTTHRSTTTIERCAAHDSLRFKVRWWEEYTSSSVWLTSNYLSNRKLTSIGCEYSNKLPLTSVVLQNLLLVDCSFWSIGMISKESNYFHSNIACWLKNSDLMKKSWWIKPNYFRSWIAFY